MMSRVVGFCTVSNVLVLGYTDMCVCVVEIDTPSVMGYGCAMQCGMFP